MLTTQMFSSRCDPDSDSQPDLTGDVVRDGSFTHVRELAADIGAYLKERDLHPRRYIWKADGAQILTKIQRAPEALAAVSMQ